MKNLGKILLLLILQNSLFADASASVDSTSVTVGDTVTYTVSLSGEDIEKPSIKSLCDSDIISTGSSTSIQSINGKMKSSYELSYQFIPTKSCVIKPLEIKIGSDKFLTKEIKIEVKAMSNSADKDFILSLHSNKKELYVGEEFEVSLLIKQKSSVRFIDSRFTPPKFNGFWVKKELKPQRYEDGDYIITKVVYVLAPQRESKQVIKPAYIKIASRIKRLNSFGMMNQNVKWKHYLSNELELDVKPLPNGVKLVGNFQIEYELKSNEVEVNEPLNLTVKVRGNGNFEDIESFKPYIKGVNIFDEKISIKNSVLTQDIAFVSDSNFTIPPFSLEFFNPDTKKIEKISTKEILVNVKNAKAKQDLNIKREENKIESKTIINYEKLSYLKIAIIFIIGLSSGIVLMLLSPWKYIKKGEKSMSLKDSKVILIKLLPYKDDLEVANIIEELEKSLYSKEKVDIDKKKLKKLIKKYNIS